MKNKLNCLLILLTLISCNVSVKYNENKSTPIAITGTWKLLTATLIEKGDTATTDYTKDKEFIKIINDTHFAFFGHDLNKGKNADSSFSAGGGNYSLKDSLYTEHLVFCNDRQWEANQFQFVVSVNNDTLIQQGIEKIDSLGVNRLNIEKYIRVKK